MAGQGGRFWRRLAPLRVRRRETPCFSRMAYAGLTPGPQSTEAVRRVRPLLITRRAAFFVFAIPRWLPLGLQQGRMPQLSRVEPLNQMDPDQPRRSGCYLSAVGSAVGGSPRGAAADAEMEVCGASSPPRTRPLSRLAPSSAPAKTTACFDRLKASRRWRYHRLRRLGSSLASISGRWAGEPLGVVNLRHRPGGRGRPSSVGRDHGRGWVAEAAGLN
jgi:hypothetical protein